MARVSLESNEHDPALQSLYRDAAAMGFVGPGGRPAALLAAMSSRPELATALWALHRGVVFEAELPLAIKAMISLAVAGYNQCTYCRVARADMMVSMGMDSALVDRLGEVDLSRLSPAQRAIIRFAIKSVADPAALSDGDRQVLFDQGLSDAEIMEIAMTAACANMWDVWAAISAVTPGT